MINKGSFYSFCNIVLRIICSIYWIICVRYGSILLIPSLNGDDDCSDFNDSDDGDDETNTKSNRYLLNIIKQ